MTPFKADHTDRDIEGTTWCCFKRVWERPPSNPWYGNHFVSFIWKWDSRFRGNGIMIGWSASHCHPSSLTIWSLIDNSSREIVSATSCCAGIIFSLCCLCVNSIFWWVWALLYFSIGTEWPLIVNIIWFKVYVFGEYNLWKLFPIIISWNDWSVAHKTGIIYWTPLNSTDYSSMASLWIIMLLSTILLVNVSWLFSIQIREMIIFFQSI